MKFSVGYQVNTNNAFMESIAKNKEHIHEVYFSWGDIPNGRNIMLSNNELYPWQAQNKQIEDLDFLSGEGIKFNLLLNGNCYGENSLSRSFFTKIGETIDYIGQRFGLKSVTTTSLSVARFIHENFDNIDVRASVNMKIGTVMGMEYVEKYFDSFYMQRELNRNIGEIKKIKKWCDQRGKGLFMLANSGCLNNCSAQTYHDNLVSHEEDIAKMDNAFRFTGVCREYLTDNLISVVRDTNFVRPEDIHLYEVFFTAAKLATRVSSNPVNTLMAYIRGKYNGAVTELLEPDHSGIFYPQIIDNSKLPGDFGKTVMSCSKNCENCSYCDNALKNATVYI